MGLPREGGWEVGRTPGDGSLGETPSLHQPPPLPSTLQLGGAERRPLPLLQLGWSSPGEGQGSGGAASHVAGLSGH